MLITVVSILVIYHLLIVNHALPIGQPVQFGNNRIARIRTYAIAPKGMYSVVFVGSSWLQGIQGPQLPKNWFNLCVGGGSALEGCNVILKTGSFPRMLVVEASERLYEIPKTDPVAEALSPWSIALMRLSPIFDLNYQPSSVFFECLGSNWVWPLHINEKARRAFVNSRRFRQPSNRELNSLQSAAKALRTKLLKIKAHGVSIIILEIPRDKDLQDTKYVAAINKALMKELPEPQFYWYRPEKHSWRTIDGAHYTEKCGQTLARMLERELLQQGLKSERD